MDRRRWGMIGPVALMGALWLCAAVAPATADDMWWGSGNFDWTRLLLGAVMGVVVFGLYVLITLGVEAWLLGVFLNIGFWRGLAYSGLANLVSAGVGVLWWVLGSQMGWKTALLEHNYRLFGFHFLRSYLVTVVVESLVIFLLLRQREEPAPEPQVRLAREARSRRVPRDAGSVLKINAAANGATYALTFLLMVVAAAIWPK